MPLPRQRDPPSPPSLRLPDGRVVEFGPLSQASRPLIQAAVASMSAQTSQRRFFTVRRQLSDAELDLLTAPDDWNRFAIGAACRNRAGTVDGVGAARFVRLPGRPSVAEMGLVVVDAYQRKGVGSVLLDALARAALTRGIDRLQGSVLPDNDAMLGLLAHRAPGLVRVTVGDPLDVEIRLDPRRAASA